MLSMIASSGMVEYSMRFSIFELLNQRRDIDKEWLRMFEKWLMVEEFSTIGVRKMTWDKNKALKRGSKTDLKRLPSALTAAVGECLDRTPT